MFWELIAYELQLASVFALMADECVAMSNQEQVAIFFRWIDYELQVHKKFVGLYQIPDIC